MIAEAVDDDAGGEAWLTMQQPADGDNDPVILKGVRRREREIELLTNYLTLSALCRFRSLT